MDIRDKKAVIFDMDGVIIDSEKIWKRAEKDIFSSFGVQITQTLARETQAMTTSEATQFWYNKFPWKQTCLKEVEQLVVARVIELIELEDCLINGVKPFIESLKSRNYKIGLATNAPSIIIPVVLKKFGIGHLFDTIASAEFEAKGKPDPAIYLTTAKKLTIKPKDCLVIEDSYSGMLAAKKAGMTVVAFTNGNRKPNFEIADYKIDCFQYRGIGSIDKIKRNLQP